MILTLYDWLNDFYCFSVSFYGFVINRCGPINKMRPHLQPKKAKVMLYFLFIYQQKTFYLPFITNSMECISFKIRCVIRMTKYLFKKTLFLRIVLQLWVKTNLYHCYQKVSYIANLLQCITHFKTKFKCACVTACFLVMSPFSHDL